MNDYDKNNLNFIMSLSPLEFKAWGNTISADDMDYAIGLLKQARTETIIQTLEIYDEVDDVNQAGELLKGIFK